MTLDRAITLLVSAILTWAATYFLGTAPALEQAAGAQVKAERRLEKIREKRSTIAELKAEIAAREAECSSLRGEP